VAFTEKERAPVSELPKPELNPMINPMLGRNLGRWAHVYFTTPPDKREEALTELLRELESQTSETPALSEPPPHSASRIQEREQIIKEFFGTSESTFSDKAEHEHLFSQVSDQPSASRAELTCPNCSYMNSTEQKYCGHCGSPVSSSARNISIERSAHSHTSPQTHDDTQWLRERALSSFEQYDAPSGGGLKYLILIFLILFGGFAYMRWVQSRPSLATASKPASVSENATPGLKTDAPAAQPASQPSEHAADSTPQPASRENLATANAEKPPMKQNPVAAALRSKETVSKSPEMGAPTGTMPAGSYQDLLLAQHYLEGRTGARNAPQAAQLLWRAVAKQNTDAAVLLSDLYARGDGVAKSCDQARLLLVAAAKKGSTQAAQQLRNFDSHPCR